MYATSCLCQILTGTSLYPLSTLPQSRSDTTKAWLEIPLYPAILMVRQVVQIMTVRLLDGTVAQFVCDREQRPVQPLHSIDFLFRDENSCPFYPGTQKSNDELTV